MAGMFGIGSRFGRRNPFDESPPYAMGGRNMFPGTQPYLGQEEDTPDNRGGFLAGIGRFVQKNPELITGLAGTAADVYGASRQGAARDRELDILERSKAAELEEERKRREDARIQMLLQAMSSGF